MILNAGHDLIFLVGEASWRSGDAEDCKSLYPGSIPGEASKKPPLFSFVTDKSYLRQTKANSAPAKTKLAALRSAAWMPIRVT